MVFLIEETGRNFNILTKSHGRHINGRLKEGYSLEDFKAVIKFKNSKWANTDMSGYIRPSTLFNSEKFDGYLQEAREASTKKTVILRGIGSPKVSDEFMAKLRAL